MKKQKSKRRKAREFWITTANGELYATFENKIRAAQSLSCFGDLAEGVGLIHVREILPKRRRGK